jgi:DNA polymerase V
MSKKLPIYFSDAAWASLQCHMGHDGKPSPTINALLENILVLEEHGFQTINAKSTIILPIPLESIPTGFPSPAQDYIDKSVDLNEVLISNPNATFLNRIKTTSMVNAGIEVGDVVIIDRSIEAKHRSIVVALIDNHELTIKRFMVSDQMSKSELQDIFGIDYMFSEIPNTWLKAESPEYQNIYLKPDQTFSVIAVVTWNLKKLG